MPLGSFHELRISASSRWYGGLITGFSYGWDIPDLDSNETDPSGKGAWTPWSMTRTVIQIEFEEARDYFLHVRCKDDAGGMTLASIKFNVISLNPTKNLCFIDDWRKYPKTGERGEPLDDMVWKTMLDGYNYGEDWEDVSWDEWEVPIAESAPSLEFLSQFQVVVWSLMDNRSSAINQQSGWYSMNCPGRSNVLAVYMTSRSSTGESGKVWAFGRGLVESSILCGAVGGFYSSCDYPYPVEEGNRCGIRRATLARDFMHIDGEFDIYDRTSGGARINLYDEAWEIADYVYVDTAGPAIPKDKYTRPPAAELYPNLPFKLLHHPDVRNRGWPFYYFEVLEYPSPDQEQQHLFYDPVSEQMTGLIPLYRTHASDPRSDANNKYCGFRYIPSKTTDPAEIVYFFFPMFPFEDSQTRATAKVVLSDWFGLPDPDALSGAVGTRR